MGMKFRNRMKKILTEEVCRQRGRLGMSTLEMAMRARMKGLCPVGI